MAAEDPPPPNGDPFLAGDETWATRRNKWKFLKIPKASVGSFLRRVVGVRHAPETISADNLNPLVLATEGQKLQTENDHLRSQIGSLNETLMISESRIRDMEIQIEALKKKPQGQDYVLLQRQIADMQRNHEALLARMQYAYKNKILQQHNDYKNLYEKFEERMQELRDLSGLHESAAQQIMELREENRVLETQRDYLIADVSKLQDSLKKSKLNLRELRDLVETLQNVVQALEDKDKVIRTRVFFIFYFLFFPYFTYAYITFFFVQKGTLVEDPPHHVDPAFEVDMSNPFAEKFKKTFANQRELGESVVKELCDPKITHILLALLNPGKLFCLGAAYFTQHPQYAQILRIPPENIFMLTGMSSNEWKEQTIERFPKFLSGNILHRQQIEVHTERQQERNADLIRRLKNNPNFLFIIDEMHIASKEKQSLHFFMDFFGYNNSMVCSTLNVKFIHVSATPEGSWMKFPQKHSKLLPMIPAPESPYYSLKKLIHNGQVRQSGDLAEQDDEGLPTRNASSIFSTCTTNSQVRRAQVLHHSMQSYYETKRARRSWTKPRSRTTGYRR